LLGATAGRTTLSGEGLQHQDGTSHLIASTVPNCRAYDPCFAYEVAVILEHGLKVTLDKQEDAFFYMTLMNENYVHPLMPEGAEEGIIRGMYLVRPSALAATLTARTNGTALAAPATRAKGHGPAAGNGKGRSPHVQLLGSGTILREAWAAADLLERDWNIAADVWSVTSFTELRRAGMELERRNRINPAAPPQLSWVETCLAPTLGPVIAATDYVRAVPDLIRTWVPRRYVTLGTDGFGRSDTRQSLRRFFEVDRTSIALAAVKALADDGTVGRNLVSEFMARYDYHPPEIPPWAADTAPRS
jgi:pyruvate dehydrogenase E1 component